MSDERQNYPILMALISRLPSRGGLREGAARVPEGRESAGRKRGLRPSRRLGLRALDVLLALSENLQEVLP